LAEELHVGVSLKGNVFQVLENGLSFFLRELISTNFLGQDISQLQHDEGRGMGAVIQMLETQRGL
jgi:hypothetical protein